MSSQFPVVSKTFEVVICEKNLDLSVKCATQQPPPGTFPVDQVKCGGTQQDLPIRPPSDPIEMNTVVVGDLIKTVKAQKEVLGCVGPNGQLLTVDVETLTEIIEQATADAIKPVLKRVEVSFCVKPAFPPPTDPTKPTNPFVASCHFEPEQGPNLTRRSSTPGAGTIGGGRRPGGAPSPDPHRGPPRTR